MTKSITHVNGCLRIRVNSIIYYLPLIQDETRQINSLMGAVTPWTLDAIYRKTKNGVWNPNYGLLYDGLHPDPQTAERMVKQILKNAFDVPLTCLYTTSMHLPPLHAL